MVRYSDDFEAVLDRVDPLAKVFRDAGYRFFLVGGVVRDYFLERFDVAQDLDATTDARPDAIKALLSEFADDLWFQGERFGTIGCVTAGQRYEITTHRAESYQPESRQPTVVFGDNIVDDLARRDFTVNAMAIDMADRSLVDPFGGQTDLAKKVLRTPLEPTIALSEDPLRMLRAARFVASCNLAAVPELVDAMSAEAGRLAIVSVERIRDELQKLLLLADPTLGLLLIGHTMVGQKIPVLGALIPFSVQSPLEKTYWHGGGCVVIKCGSWETATGRVRAVPTDAAMRWAALLSSSEADVPVAVTKADLRSLKFSRDLAREVMWLLTEGAKLLKPHRLSLSDQQLRELARGCPPGHKVEDLLIFARGLLNGDRYPIDKVDQVFAALSDLRRREPDLDDPKPFFGGLEVADMLGVEPGPELGKAMNYLAQLRVEHGPLDAAVAAAKLRVWWDSSDSLDSSG